MLRYPSCGKPGAALVHGDAMHRGGSAFSNQFFVYKIPQSCALTTWQTSQNEVWDSNP
ncbi:MAG: hypothetical protein FWG42_01845 [Clostridiales bacterium]|nr:hypothetical protein [Clostridiales bacterium]